MNNSDYDEISATAFHPSNKAHWSYELWHQLLNNNTLNKTKEIYTVRKYPENSDNGKAGYVTHDTQIEMTSQLSAFRNVYQHHYNRQFTDNSKSVQSYVVHQISS